MATVNFIPCSKQCASSLKNELAYILQDVKVCIDRDLRNTDHTLNYQSYSADSDKGNAIRLISGKDCCPETSFQEFMATKNSYKKADKTMFYHYSQSFKDGETISPKTAHEIAVKFAEENYPDFEVVIATHVDNEHIHSHFIINSVSFQTGKKLHEGPKTLLKLRAYSDQICQQYGLTTLEPYMGGKSKSLGSREYRAAVKGESWKFQLMNTIDHAMKISRTKKDFIRNMEGKDYKVRWEDTRKSITYTCPNTKACRDLKLHDPRYRKEMMEREFELRRTEAEEQRYTGNRENTRTHRAGASECGSLQPENFERPTDSIADANIGYSAPHLSGEPIHESADTKNRFAETSWPAGANAEGLVPDTRSDFTGWEEERATLFHAKTPFTQTGMDASMGDDSHDFSGLASDVVQLGRAVEGLGNTAPIVDSTTQIIPKSRKKKQTLGQKEDDYESQDYKMALTM